MAIVIPSVRNKNKASTADVIAEQIILCELNLKTIEKHATFRKERELRDEINRKLRVCHDFLGMAGSRKNGCLYREKNANNPLVCEHSIPVSALVDLYQKGIPFKELVFYPVARISSTSDMKFQKLGLVKSGHSDTAPFLRYHKAEIVIETHEGQEIDVEYWSMKDHWNLVERTEDLAKIRCHVLSKLKNDNFSELS